MSRHSDFWLTEDDYDWDFIDDPDVSNESDDSDEIDEEQIRSENTARLIKLSSARRAIANYVTILTGKSIPVLFNDHAVNCTDGTTVYLSSDITKRENFDVAVGLALHEGSHIVYSDFDLFKNVWMNVPRSIYNYAEKLNISKEYVGIVCKDILNYVEDRYIDYTVHSNAPGYRGYYDALYDKYFNAKSITDALNSDLYKVASIDSYLFRIINLTNSNTSLKALPGLYDIAKELNLSNISRLTTPKDRLNVAYNIAEIVFKNITEYKELDKKSQSSSAFEVEPIEGTGGKPSDGKSIETTGISLDDLIGGTETSVTTVDENVTNIGSDEKISKSKLDKIKKAFEKQKNFLNGTLKKKKVTRKEKELLDILEKSKVEIVDVARDLLKSSNIVGSVECVLVKNMTKELVTSNNCPLYIGDGNVISFKENQRWINEGIILGVKLGRRLQLRNEINVQKFSRRYTGKLDKRLIHELGFSDENIFYTTMTEKYKKVNFHISIDASSSMSGSKWNRTIKLCTALAKAVSMLDNVYLTISFRSTINQNPYILIAYNSKVDKFSKIRNLFPYLRTCGTTPEGLCYEALMKYLPSYSNDTNSYFVNISDGEPFFFLNNQNVSINYSGMDAANHTRNQVKKIKSANYNVISYFVSESNPTTDVRDRFKIMYGDDAKFINIESLNQIVGTLNKKMMESLDI